MPIRSECPHCSAAFKVDETYVGQMVVCTKCKNQYQVTPEQTPAAAPAPTATPVSSGPANPGTAAPAVGPVGVAPNPSGAIPRSRRRARRPSFFSAPSGGSPFRSKLWLGLLLFVGTFAAKQVVVDFSLVRTNSATEVGRVQLAKEAAKNSVSHQASELEQEIRDMRFLPNADQSEISKKQKLLDKVLEENRAELDKINKKYSKLASKAQRRLTAAASTNLLLLQMSWWLKLLLDLAKIAGCFLVLYSAIQIVCDPDEDKQVKTFATVCSGVVLTTILALSVLAVFS